MSEGEKKIGVGIGVMILKDGQVLLGKRHDDPEKAKSLLKGAGTWTMPGGKLRFKETFSQAAQREVEEETGLKIINPQFLCVNEDILEDVHFVTIGLLAENFTGVLETREPEEITEWQWFSLDSLPTPLYFPSKKVLDCFLENWPGK